MSGFPATLPGEPDTDIAGPGEADGGRWDTVVVGAGPAGSMAARELARRGLRVLLVDRQEFPRFKVCGCCVGREALEELADAGLEGLVASRGGPRLRELRVAVRGHLRRLPLGGGRALSRARLDTALVESARRAGAKLCLGARAEPAAATVSHRELRLQMDGGTAALAATMVVAADGLGSSFLRAARKLDGEAVDAPASSGTVGVGAVLQPGPGPEPGVVAMAVGKAGYVGLVRLEDGSVEVAAALRRRVLAAAAPVDLVLDLVRDEGLAAELGLDTARIRSAAWSGTPALRRRPDRLLAERVVAVGDAAGYWEPFTGEGIAWALRGARRVADLVPGLVREWSPGRAGRWEAAALRDRDRSQRHCRRVAAVMAHPRLADGLLAIVERWPGLLSLLLPGQRLLRSGDWRPGWEGRP